MNSTRDQIIRTVCTLMETQGYHATGLKQIVAESGSPKGSLYHYFPDGKEGLTAEAIARVGEVVEGRIQSSLAAEPEAGLAVERFILTIAHYVASAGYRSGGPLTMIAMETAATSERLSNACSLAFQRWHAVFAEKLIANGYSTERAASLATLILATIEGAVLLSRTHHSVAPLEQVAAELRALLQSARPDNPI